MEDTKTLAPENTEQPETDMISLQGIREAHLGSKIRAIRKSQGMKQEVLAQMVKVTQSKISAIELTGEVDSRTLKKIADALEVSAGFIKRFEPEEAVYQVQNNYMGNAQSPTPQVGEFDQSENTTNSHNDNSNNVTNSFDVIQHMVDSLKETYNLLIAEHKETIKELKAENKELRAKK